MSRRRREDEDRATLAPGQLAVPNVRLVRKIAEGGMGSVWEGEHLALRTNVAVKFVVAELGDSQEVHARFEREATAAARIRSPHVVQVLDHGVTTDEGVPYIVMELLIGEDLEQRLEREGKLPLDLVAHIVIQTSKALSKAHAMGVVHRDIKPSNVFLTEEGGEVFVKVLDFGIAKLTVADVARMRVTQTGAMIGTPVYMAPEQMTQSKDVGPQADVWSVGVLAYLALTGLLPYDSDTVAGLAMAIERGKYPRAGSLVDGLPAEVDAWFERAIAKDPADRFATVREMAEALAKAAGFKSAPASVLSPTSTPPPPLSGFASDPPPKADAAPASGVAATLVEASDASKRTRSALADRTMMGASSATARSEARSSTRTVMWAGIILLSLGVGAAGYAALRGTPESNSAPDAAAAHATPTTTATDSAPPADPTVSELPTSEPSQAVSAAPESSGAPSASTSMSATASPAPSVPKLWGTLPKAPASSQPAAASASAKPSATAPNSAAPSPPASASVKPPPAPASAAPKAPAPKAPAPKAPSSGAP